MKTTCGSLLFELQKIWDEIGEADNEKDKMLLELEQECLDVYRRKVDHANRCRAQLRQAIADAEAQLADIYAALGDRPVHINKSSGSLKNELESIMPRVEDMKRKRDERKSQFAELQELAMTMVELWNLMDTPVVEQQKFQYVTRTIAAAEHEITEPNSLSLDFIHNAEAEVSRLQDMKINLSVESIESGAISPSYILEQLEFQISKVKEESFQ
ncbi:65-kda microtubule-associated protein 3 [Phtheirospermum japonicum]|uniref:65-kDa microtubule-associated protein 3 n=1 Tax=Phtheirospermum japonicum TaxID=374723 RepID=A0A830DEY5_9LAMI|nr:65-kda microtubule-associated protein 3 [Phtheirospermum japonicum]